MYAFFRYGFEVSVSIEFSEVIYAIGESGLIVRITLL